MEELPSHQRAKEGQLGVGGVLVEGAGVLVEGVGLREEAGERLGVESQFAPLSRSGAGSAVGCQAPQS